MGELVCELIPVYSFKERIRITKEYTMKGYHVEIIGDCVYVEIKKKNRRRLN